MQWTKMQKRAIEARGSSLLVSAAAGSGKTTVMVERILSLALEGVPLDRMLIVTFTRAAASSMREKLTRELERRMQAQPQNAMLRRQSEALRRADISTYSSFLANVLRQYYYLLDIPPDFKILDQARLARLQDEALEKVLEQAEDIPFLEDLYRLLVKGGKDKSLCDAILLIYGHISIFPYPQKRLEEMLKDYSSGGEIWINAERRRMQDELICLREDADALKPLAAQVGGKNNCEQVAEYDAQLIEALLAAENFEEMAALKPSPYMSLRIKDGFSGVFRPRHEVIKSAVQGIMAQAGEYAQLLKYDDLPYLRGCMEALFELVRRFSDTLFQLKLEEGSFYFSDIDCLSARLLDNEQAAYELKNRYDYIFVDEYQDNNKLQEHILSRLSRGNNIFYVGDVKQSIYRFRNADPSIFIKRERAFGAGEGENIYLNNNFRSCGGILDFVNFIFERIMKRETLGLEYDINASLRPLTGSWQSLLGTEECSCSLGNCLKPAVPAEVMLLDYDEQDMPEEFEQYKKQKLEALAVARRIKEIMDEPIYDPAMKCCRMPQLRDIVILARSANELAGAYQEVFKSEGIPLYTEPQAGLLSSHEAGIITSLLSLIAGSGEDEALLAVLLSPIGGFNENELALVRSYVKDGSFSQAAEQFMDMTESGGIGQRLHEFFAKIESWNFLSYVLPLEQLIWRIYEETGYYYYVSALPMGQVRAENLRQLARRAGEYMLLSGESLSGFLSYLEFGRKLGGDIEEGATLGEKDDVVRLMTIHKSKGLEFPICLLVSCGQAFNKNEARQNIQLDSELGIGVKMRRLNKETGVFEVRQSMARAAIAAKKAEEGVAEEARLLYVGMTRAISRLIVCGTITPKSQFAGGKYSIAHANSFLEFIMPALLRHPDAEILRERFEGFSREPGGGRIKISIRDAHSLREEKEEPVSELLQNALKEGKRDISYLEERFSRRYALEAATRLRSKRAVTELFGDREVPLRRPSFMRELSGAQMGNLYHTAMERLDIRGDVSVRGISAQLDGMVDKGIFTPEERALVKPEKLAAFFEGEIGKRLLSANKVYREEPFCIWVEQEGERVLVQGVIDCYFIEDGHAVLIDYKTDSAAADSEKTAQRHRPQLEMYALAIKEITGLNAEGWLYMFSDTSFHKLV